CFFFQAEDGIRYLIVTGVQTCALPILEIEISLADTQPVQPARRLFHRGDDAVKPLDQRRQLSPIVDRITQGNLLQCNTRLADLRSEERRVGKECKSRWSA